VPAPDQFATSTDAAAYGYTLPSGTADELLARATQAIRDEAGIPLTQTTSTLELYSDCGVLELPGGLVASITSVSLVNDDDTLTAITDYTWDRDRKIRLGCSVSWSDRRHGLWSVVYVHGFASLPASLTALTCAVANRLATIPAAAAAGLQSATVGSVSWTAGEIKTAALTEAEVRTLARVVPVRRVFQVPL
jgi:hypothetical protein